VDSGNLAFREYQQVEKIIDIYNYYLQYHYIVFYQYCIMANYNVGDIIVLEPGNDCYNELGQNEKLVGNHTVFHVYPEDNAVYKNKLKLNKNIRIDTQFCNLQQVYPDTPPLGAPPSQRQQSQRQQSQPNPPLQRQQSQQPQVRPNNQFLNLTPNTPENLKLKNKDDFKLLKIEYMIEKIPLINNYADVKKLRDKFIKKTNELKYLQDHEDKIDQINKKYKNNKNHLQCKIEIAEENLKFGRDMDKVDEYIFDYILLQKKYKLSYFERDNKNKYSEKEFKIRYSLEELKIDKENLKYKEKYENFDLKEQNKELKTLLDNLLKQYKETTINSKKQQIYKDIVSNENAKIQNGYKIINNDKIIKIEELNIDKSILQLQTELDILIKNLDVSLAEKKIIYDIEKTKLKQAILDNEIKAITKILAELNKFNGDLIPTYQMQIKQHDLNQPLPFITGLYKKKLDTAGIIEEIDKIQENQKKGIIEEENKLKLKKDEIDNSVKILEKKLKELQNPYIPLWYTIFPPTQDENITTPQKEKFEAEMMEKKRLEEERLKEKKEKIDKEKLLAKELENKENERLNKEKLLAKELENKEKERLNKEKLLKEEIAEKEYYEKRKPLIEIERQRVKLHNEAVDKQKEELFNYFIKRAPNNSIIAEGKKRGLKGEKLGKFIAQQLKTRKKKESNNKTKKLSPVIPFQKLEQIQIPVTLEVLQKQKKPSPVILYQKPVQIQKPVTPEVLQKQKKPSPVILYQKPVQIQKPVQKQKTPSPQNKTIKCPPRCANGSRCTYKSKKDPTGICVKKNLV